MDSNKILLPSKHFLPSHAASDFVLLSALLGNIELNISPTLLPDLLLALKRCSGTAGLVADCHFSALSGNLFYLSHVVKHIPIPYGMFRHCLLHLPPGPSEISILLPIDDVLLEAISLSPAAQTVELLSCSGSLTDDSAHCWARFPKLKSGGITSTHGAALFGSKTAAIFEALHNRDRPPPDTRTPEQRRADNAARREARLAAAKKQREKAESDSTPLIRNGFLSQRITPGAVSVDYSKLPHLASLHLSGPPGSLTQIRKWPPALELLSLKEFSHTTRDLTAASSEFANDFFRCLIAAAGRTLIRLEIESVSVLIERHHVEACVNQIPNLDSLALFNSFGSRGDMKSCLLSHPNLSELVQSNAAGSRDVPVWRPKLERLTLRRCFGSYREDFFRLVDVPLALPNLMEITFADCFEPSEDSAADAVVLAASEPFLSGLARAKRLRSVSFNDYNSLLDWTRLNKFVSLYSLDMESPCIACDGISVLLGSLPLLGKLACVVSDASDGAEELKLNNLRHERLSFLQISIPAVDRRKRLEPKETEVNDTDATEDAIDPPQPVEEQPSFRITCTITGTHLPNLQDLRVAARTMGAVLVLAVDSFALLSQLEVSHSSNFYSRHTQWLDLSITSCKTLVSLRLIRIAVTSFRLGAVPKFRLIRAYSESKFAIGDLDDETLFSIDLGGDSARRPIVLAADSLSRHLVQGAVEVIGKKFTPCSLEKIDCLPSKTFR